MKSLPENDGASEDEERKSELDMEDNLDENGEKISNEGGGS